MLKLHDKQPKQRKVAVVDDAISGFNDWTEALKAAYNTWHDMSLSELHGFATGVCCVVNAPTESEWQNIFTNGFVAPMPKELLAFFTEEAADIHEQLKDIDDAYEFEPLLPDESHALIKRINALATWADGFLTGYGLTGSTPQPDEVELLKNLQKLGRLKSEEEDSVLLDELADNDSDSNDDFEELLEFARIVPVSLSSKGKFRSVSQLPIIAGLTIDGKVRNSSNLQPVENRASKPS